MRLAGPARARMRGIHVGRLESLVELALVVTCSDVRKVEVIRECRTIEAYRPHGSPGVKDRPILRIEYLVRLEKEI